MFKVTPSCDVIKYSRCSFNDLPAAQHYPCFEKAHVENIKLEKKNFFIHVLSSYWFKYSNAFYSISCFEKHTHVEKKGWVQ